MKRLFSNMTNTLVVLAIVVICVAIIADRFFLRLDLTEDNVYSLSAGSKRIAAQLEEPVQVKFYFSESLEDLPPPFKTFGHRVEEILREFASHSDSKMTVEVIDPKPDSDAEVWARKYGIRGIELPSGYEAYLGAVFLLGDKEHAIPYLDPRKEEFLEYDIAEAIVQLRQDEKPRLAIHSSLPVAGGGSFNPSRRFNNKQAWAFMSSLRNSFEVTTLAKDPETLPENLDVLVLMHPKNISEKFEYLVDQYVMEGGRLIVLVDSFSRVDLSHNSQAMTQSGQMPQTSSNLDRLFKAWGLRFHAKEIVGDPQRATRIRAGSRETSYPFFLSLTADDLNDETKITANLKQMLFAESGWFEVINENDAIKSTPLVETTKQSGTLNPSMASFMNPDDLASQLKPDDKVHTLALMLQGQFSSAFSKIPEGVENSDLIAKATKDSAIVLIGDIDFLHDSNAVDRIPFINQVIVRPKNDNLNLMINAAEYLGGSQDLIAIRSSGRVQRPFTKVRELRQQAQEKWKEQEENLSQQLRQLQNKLSDLQNRRSEGNRAILSSAQQKEIQKFREQEAEVRTKRRQVRKKLREDIEALEHTLVALNLLLVPSLVSGLGLFVFWRREKRAKEGV